MKTLSKLAVGKIDLEEARRHFDLPIEEQFSNQRDLVAGLSATKAQLLAMFGEGETITVIRGMDLDAGWAATVQPGDDLGESWAWQESGALKGSGLGIGEAPGVLIEARVEDDNVDWATTVAVNTFHEDECEIVLFDGSRVEPLRIMEWPSRDILREWEAQAAPAF